MDNRPLLELSPAHKFILGLGSMMLGAGVVVYTIKAIKVKVLLRRHCEKNQKLLKKLSPLQLELYHDFMWRYFLSELNIDHRRTLPADFVIRPYDSKFDKNLTALDVAQYIMRALAKNGNRWKKLKWIEYSNMRCEMLSETPMNEVKKILRVEKRWFDKVLPYTQSLRGTKLLGGKWNTTFRKHGINHIEV